MSDHRSRERGMKARKLKALGAATDNPEEIIDRAIRQAVRSSDKSPRLDLREAAEMGWLAISSLADVLADKVGERNAGGANGRFNVLEAAEKKGGLKKGRLTLPFVAARSALHGDCFHEDRCERKQIMPVLESIQEATRLASGLKVKKKR